MSDHVELEHHHSPWQPTPESKAIREYHRYDAPLLGVLTQHGVPYLFWCLHGVVERVSIWAYVTLTDREVWALDEAEPAGTHACGDTLGTCIRAWDRQASCLEAAMGGLEACRGKEARRGRSLRGVLREVPGEARVRRHDRGAQERQEGRPGHVPGVRHEGHADPRQERQLGNAHESATGAAAVSSGARAAAPA
jgi:hypothetical protein